MGKKYETCLKEVRKKIKLGILPKTYLNKRKKCKSNEYALCSHLKKK